MEIRSDSPKASTWKSTLTRPVQLPRASDPPTQLNFRAQGPLRSIPGVIGYKLSPRTHAVPPASQQQHLRLLISTPLKKNGYSLK